MARLYDNVKTAIRGDIQRGRYKTGERIPSESQLTRTLGVSAITIRRALRDLVIEGVLIGRQGLGVFVADNRCIVRSLRSDFRNSLADEIRRAGLEPRIHLLASADLRGPKSVTELLQVRPGSALFGVEKLILADERPVSIERDYLPARLSRLNNEITDDYLIPLLFRRDVRIAYVDYRVEGGPVSAPDAALLELSPGTPILKIFYTPIGPSGAPVATGMSVSRADRFSYEFRVNIGLKRKPAKAGQNGARPAR